MIFSYLIINITRMQYVDKENVKKLGKKIKELRLKKSTSLNSFVLQRGYLTTATWSRIENGLYDLKFSTLLRVACMLDISLQCLLENVSLNYNFDND